MALLTEAGQACRPALPRHVVSTTLHVYMTNVNVPLSTGAGRSRRAALTNTTSVNRFMVTAVLEDMRVPLAKERPAVWRKVAEAIQLTHEQRAEIVQLWRAFR